MANAITQQNLPKRSDKFYRVPLSYHEMRLPVRDKEGNIVTTPDGEPILRRLHFSDIIVFGLIYAFSHMKRKPNKPCVRSYSEIEEETDYTRGTIAETIWASKCAGIVKQKKHFHDKAEYQCVGFPKDEFYITFEHFLFTDKFYVPEEGKKRKLSKWEIWIISLFGSMCNKPDAKGCDFTIEELCKLSGACEKTMRKAICKTINMGFVSSRNRLKYARKDKRLHFNVAREVRLLMKHETRTREVPEKSAYESRREEEIQAANMRSERERYFARNYNAAVSRMEENRKRANKDTAFKQADAAIKAGEIEFARAEIYAPETVEDIRIRLEKAHRDRTAALARLNLTIEDIEVPPWTCKECSDSGFLPDGRMCDCYTPPGGDP